MTLDETLLSRLAEWRSAGPGPHQFATALSDSGWTLSVTADQAESLGCRATELSVRRAARPADAAALTQWADRCARRVTGLLEPLRVIEVDVTRDEALLRSDAPAARGDDVSYYELLLKGVHAATLRRYRATKTAGGREA